MKKLIVFPLVVLFIFVFAAPAVADVYPRKPLPLSALTRPEADRMVRVIANIIKEKT